MTVRLEHANITVPDIDAALDFLSHLAPDFAVMHDGQNPDGYRWVHFGTPQNYLALEEPHEPTPDAGLKRSYRDYGVNHLGLVVDDVDSTAERLKKAGYKENHVSERHPARLRRYFLDSAGMEWELVQYLSDDDTQRFSY